MLNWISNKRLKITICSWGCIWKSWYLRLRRSAPGLSWVWSPVPISFVKFLPALSAHSIPTSKPVTNHWQHKSTTQETLAGRFSSCQTNVWLKNRVLTSSQFHGYPGIICSEIIWLIVMSIINIYIYIYTSEVPMNLIYLFSSMLAPCHASFSLCRVAADLLISTRLETKSHRNYFGCNCIIMAILLNYQSKVFYGLLLRFQINHVCSEFRPMSHLCSYGALYIFTFDLKCFTSPFALFSVATVSNSYIICFTYIVLSQVHKNQTEQLKIVQY